MKRAWRWIAGVAAAAILAAAFGFWLRPVSYFNGWMYVQEMFSGVESRSVTVQGHRMHYLAEGPSQGEAVVLVHGLGGRAEDWRLLAPYLAKAGYRVYIPDLFGYGRSESPRDFSYSVEDEAAAVTGFMDAMNLKQIDLGGWSMGGWIVQLVAGRNPERVRRLMLFDSAGLRVQPTWDTSLFVPRTAAELDTLEMLLTPHPQRIPAFVSRDILRVSREREWVMRRALETMWTGKDTTDALLPQLKMPVLIAWGTEDRIMPLQQGEKMHALTPDSELTVFNGCGHLAPGQCAREMGPAVIDFLKQ